MNLATRYQKSLAQANDPITRALLEFLLTRDDADPVAFGEIKATLFHGTPADMIDTMLKGIIPQEHGILGGDWLCVSPNDNMLSHFGENGVNGLVADNVVLNNCLLLGTRHLAFMLDLATGDNNDKNHQLEKWFETRGIESWKLQTEDLARAWHYLPPELEAFVWPDCHRRLIPGYGWNGACNHEAEISLTEAGCRVFAQAISQIVRHGKWQDHPKMSNATEPTGFLREQLKINI
ncbi:hypothetical protein OH491_23535 [Termitidicoccus mucosus]|uniref:Uncharacterized protein n=1 Tax=Termitidicoccus mucosus TaxID=1184151 RepID=A0A178IQ73_9BACT|nr:hypothetical protein AW736_02935 [Opitutaceae bacterium TSB47]